MDQQITEQKYFFDFFYRIFTSMKEEHEPGSEIEDFGSYFSGGAEGACAAENFPTEGHRLHYFYWSSPVSAGVSRKETLAALQLCEEFSSYLRSFVGRQLKVVSAAAGTGSDLVGLYSALYEYFKQFTAEPSIFQSMEVLLIDIYDIWMPYFFELDKLLRDKNYYFGNATQFMGSESIATSSMCANLAHADLLQELVDAQIVWMKGIMAILRSNTTRIRIVKNIVSSMTVGALLLVLDSPSYLEHVRSDDRLKEIYKPPHPSKYELPYNSEFPLYCRQTNQQLFIFKKSKH